MKNLSTHVPILLFIMTLLAGCNSQPSTFPSGNNIAVSWEITSIQYGDSPTSLATITFINNNESPLSNKGWTLYFNQLPRRIIKEELPPEIVIEHIEGDFYRLYPTDLFPPLEPNHRISFSYSYEGTVFRKNDAPIGLYLVFDDNPTPEPISDYQVIPTKRGLLQATNIPDAATRFKENQTIFQLPEEELPAVIPRPIRQQFMPGVCEVKTSIGLTYPDDLANEALFLEERLKSVFTGIIVRNQESPNPSIELKLGNLSSDGNDSEAYTLEISETGVVITGSAPAGVFYGIQSLIGLLPLESLQQPMPVLSIPNLVIEDAPRFGYRGMHLDVSRNFHSKASVEKLLDLMAFYKLNKLHFHITDDEGWRLEIPGLPELTEVGARRGHTPDESDMLMPLFGSGPFADPEKSYGTGHYTRAEFIEILQFAHTRHIEVIPELDFPGHARAAIKAMNARYNRLMEAGKPEEAAKYLLEDPADQSEYSSAQWYDDNVICVCQESSYDFVEKVVDEVVAMYKEADVPLNIIHSGGDEVPHGVWEKSPVCADFIANSSEINSVDELHPYFMNRFHAFMVKHNLITAGWEEIVMHAVTKDGKTVSEPNPEFVDKKFMPFVWNAIWGWGGEDLAYKLANLGYPVVMCNATNLYFDMASNPDPEENGFNWADYVDTRRPFELVPFDLFKTATIDKNGNPLDIPTLTKGKTKLTERGKQFFMGIQGELWSETVQGQDMLEHQVFPKLLALAERAWAPDPAWAQIEDRTKRFEALEVDWNVFANALGQRELPRLDHMFGGVNYRLPLPGAVVEDGILKANIRFPGLVIRFTDDGSEPDANSPIYSEPINVKGSVKLKSFDQRGRASRTSQVDLE